ncbi:MAG: class I SAM-dependent methyltransferase [Acidobacteria bacterium]|nr:class I SAM-dependent methyltransferase [Acidobacteriota bacterium]
MIKARDAANLEMVSVWDKSIPETAEVVHWAKTGSSSVAWQRWLHWKQELGLGDDLKTIELGCGYGKISLLFGLSGAQTMLFDYNEAALTSAEAAHAKLGLNPRLLGGDLLNLPAELHGQFDVACSFGTLEHFFGDNRSKAVAATASVLRPGGVFFVTVPYRYATWYRIGFGARYWLGLMARGMKEKPFSRAELGRLADDAGVEILELESVTTFWGDFQDWIGENLMSLTRKVTGWPQRVQPPTEVGIEGLDVSALRQLAPRSYLDRHFSYSLLLIGRKRPDRS